MADKLLLVTADDRDYDSGGQWFVGVFTTKRRANKAIREETAAYKKQNGARQTREHFSISCVEIEVNTNYVGGV